MTLYSWSTPGETLQIAHFFEDWQGLVSGLVLCRLWDALQFFSY